MFAFIITIKCPCGAQTSFDSAHSVSSVECDGCGGILTVSVSG